jgi:hypothetical protein
MCNVDHDHWQDAVNAAEMLLLLSRAQSMGMLEGLTVNREQCNFVLKRGQELRVFPDVLERRIRRLQPA